LAQRSKSGEGAQRKEAVTGPHTIAGAGRFLTVEHYESHCRAAPSATLPL